MQTSDLIRNFEAAQEAKLRADADIAALVTADIAWLRAHPAPAFPPLPVRATVPTGEVQETAPTRSRRAKQARDRDAPKATSRRAQRQAAVRARDRVAAEAVAAAATEKRGRRAEKDRTSLDGGNEAPASADVDPVLDHAGAAPHRDSEDGYATAPTSPVGGAAASAQPAEEAEETEETLPKTRQRARGRGKEEEKLITSSSPSPPRTRRPRRAAAARAAACMTATAAANRGRRRLRPEDVVEDQVVISTANEAALVTASQKDADVTDTDAFHGAAEVATLADTKVEEANAEVVSVQRFIVPRVALPTADEPRERCHDQVMGDDADVGQEEPAASVPKTTAALPSNSRQTRATRSTRSTRATRPEKVLSKTQGGRAVRRTRAKKVEPILEENCENVPPADLEAIVSPHQSGKEAPENVVDESPLVKRGRRKAGRAVSKKPLGARTPVIRRRTRAGARASIETSAPSTRSTRAANRAAGVAGKQDNPGQDMSMAAEQTPRRRGVVLPWRAAAESDDDGDSSDSDQASKESDDDESPGREGADEQMADVDRHAHDKGAVVSLRSGKQRQKDDVSKADLEIAAADDSGVSPRAGARPEIAGDLAEPDDIAAENNQEIQKNDGHSSQARTRSENDVRENASGAFRQPKRDGAATSTRDNEQNDAKDADPSTYRREHHGDVDCSPGGELKDGNAPLNSQNDRTIGVDGDDEDDEEPIRRTRRRRPAITEVAEECAEGPRGTSGDQISHPGAEAEGCEELSRKTRSRRGGKAAPAAKPRPKRRGAAGRKGVKNVNSKAEANLEKQNRKLSDALEADQEGAVPKVEEEKPVPHSSSLNAEVGASRVKIRSDHHHAEERKNEAEVNRETSKGEIGEETAAPQSVDSSSVDTNGKDGGAHMVDVVQPEKRSSTAVADEELGPSLTKRERPGGTGGKTGPSESFLAATLAAGLDGSSTDSPSRKKQRSSSSAVKVEGSSSASDGVAKAHAPEEVAHAALEAPNSDQSHPSQGNMPPPPLPSAAIATQQDRESRSESVMPPPPPRRPETTVPVPPFSAETPVRGKAVAAHGRRVHQPLTNARFQVDGNGKLSTAGLGVLNEICSTPLATPTAGARSRLNMPQSGARSSRLFAATENIYSSTRKPALGRIRPVQSSAVKPSLSAAKPTVPMDSHTTTLRAPIQRLPRAGEAPPTATPSNRGVDSTPVLSSRIPIKGRRKTRERLSKPSASEPQAQMPSTSKPMQEEIEKSIVPAEASTRDDAVDVTQDAPDSREPKEKSVEGAKPELSSVGESALPDDPASSRKRPSAEMYKTAPNKTLKRARIAFAEEPAADDAQLQKTANAPKEPLTASKEPRTAPLKTARRPRIVTTKSALRSRIEGRRIAADAAAEEAANGSQNSLPLLTPGAVRPSASSVSVVGEGTPEKFSSSSVAGDSTGPLSGATSGRGPLSTARARIALSSGVNNPARTAPSNPQTAPEEKTEPPKGSVALDSPGKAPASQLGNLMTSISSFLPSFRPQKSDSEEETAEQKAAAAQEVAEADAKRRAVELSKRREAARVAKQKEAEEKQRRVEAKRRLMAQAEQHREEERRRKEQERARKLAEAEEQRKKQKEDEERRREQKRKRVEEQQRKLAAEEAERRRAYEDKERAQRERLKRAKAGGAGVAAASTAASSQKPGGAGSSTQGAKAKAPAPESYEMTASKDNGDADSSDSEAEQSRRMKRIPGWARSSNLPQSLVGETRDPDTIFEKVNTINLEEVFQGHQQKRRFRARTSSGMWVRDRLTAKEELEYKKVTTGFGGPMPPPPPPPSSG